MSYHIWFTLRWNVLPHLVHTRECPVTFGSHWGKCPATICLWFWAHKWKLFEPEILNDIWQGRIGRFSSLFCFVTRCKTSKMHHYLLTYLSIYLLIYLFILSIYLRIYSFMYLFIYIFIYLSTYLIIYLSIYLHNYLSIYLFIYLFTYLPIYLPLPRDGWKAPILKRAHLKSQPSSLSLSLGLALWVQWQLLLSNKNSHISLPNFGGHMLSKSSLQNGPLGGPPTEQPLTPTI
jgi:hypothetical protein